MTSDDAPVKVSNLLSGTAPPGPEESFATILERPGIRIERIVSHGHTTPPDAPFDQVEDEWVMLARGAARLWMEGGGEFDLAPGDHLLIPAGRRHRVTWTSPDEPTIWLAVHIAAREPDSKRASGSEPRSGSDPIDPAPTGSARADGLRAGQHAIGDG